MPKPETLSPAVWERAGHMACDVRDAPAAPNARTRELLLEIRDLK